MISEKHKWIIWRMIRILLTQRLDDKAFAEKRRITLDEVAEQTGISRATLTRIANRPGYNLNMHALEALCRYFACGPGDVVQLVDD